MVNEDILTSLRNSIERGESLQSSIQILINSGYNKREVEEASKFISQGAIKLQEIKSDEHLALLNKKPLFSQGFKLSQKAVPINKPILNLNAIQKSPQLNEIQQIKQEVSHQQQYQPLQQPLLNPQYNSNQQYSSNQQDIQPKKDSYFKEIVLLIILLILIGVLIGTILFKQDIISFFSGLG